MGRGGDAKARDGPQPPKFDAFDWDSWYANSLPGQVGTPSPPARSGEREPGEAFGAVSATAHCAQHVFGGVPLCSAAGVERFLPRHGLAELPLLARLGDGQGTSSCFGVGESATFPFLA